MYISLDFEQIGMRPFHGQAARIIQNIRLHALQLPFSIKNHIVITIFPEARQVALDEFLIDMITSHLEAIDDLTEMYGNPFLNKNNKMEVVWHQLEGPDSNLGIELGDIDKRLHHGPAKWCGLHNGRLGLTIAHECSKQRPPFLDNQSDHIDATALIVMPHPAALH